MAIQPTYPGVYVQEVPSGVRTITGVSTSVTAFVGEAKRGPIDKAVKIFSYSDFERRFGGLSKDLEMGYGVRQFFMNGGTQAIIVRVAGSPVAAFRTLHSGTREAEASGNAVLTVTAIDSGSDGNQIEVRIDYNTDTPQSTFNLTVNYFSVTNPGENLTELFKNVSMNSFHPRYVENIVKQTSKLVEVKRIVTVATLNGLGAGNASSGEIDLAALGTLIDATHNSFRLSINGSDPIPVKLNPSTFSDICMQIRDSVNGHPEFLGFTCIPAPATSATPNKILMTSGASGENSRVEVLPGLGNDVAARLKLAVGLGGSQNDAVSAISPREIPDNSTLTTGEIIADDITAITNTWSAASPAQRFLLSLDGRVPNEIKIPTTSLTVGKEIEDIANRIRDSVRILRPTIPAYRDFTCEVIDVTATSKKIVLSSGSGGKNSSVSVSEVSGDTFASTLHLLSSTGATTFQATDTMLQGGSELPITDVTRYSIFTGSQANRTGIYALESEDIFNIMCLPGIEDSGILMEADTYCQNRRAFLIIDSPSSTVKSLDMNTVIAGGILPKSDHAAVYYPWVKISDPLNGGAVRKTAPSGTMAGLYARTDANRGVWKAPAGIEATLNGVRGLDYTLTDGENGLLNPLGVNCLRVFPDSGAISWGGRTLRGDDRLASEYKYIPVRRTALYIEESLFRGLKWVVFESNDEPLWGQIRLNVGAFMNDLFRKGAFQGTKKDDAYFVKCDKETTTQNDINLGIVNVWVGFAPLKPAEFVLLYLQQMSGQIQV